MMMMAEEEDDAGLFEYDDVGAGDEFMAVLPWKGQAIAPSGWRKPPVNQKKPPAINLELEWVYGYRTRDSRNNIGIMLDQSIVYHAAALGIGYDPTSHT